MALPLRRSGEGVGRGLFVEALPNVGAAVTLHAEVARMSSVAVLMATVVAAPPPTVLPSRCLEILAAVLAVRAARVPGVETHPKLPAVALRARW
jgi:hypothetical protein